MNEFTNKLIEELTKESRVVATPIAEMECLKLSDAIDAVNRVAEEYGNQVISSNDLEIIGALPSLYPLQDFEEKAIQRVVRNNTDEWIPCERELPPQPQPNIVFENKPLELYLVTIKNTEYPFRAIWNGKIFTDGFSKVDAIAWQPLPKVYQSGGQI